MNQDKRNEQLQPSEKRLVLNVIKYFDREKVQNAPLFPYSCSIKRTVEATGLSETTIKRLRKLTNSGMSENELFLHPKKRTRAKRIVIDDHTICAIRKKISEFYINKKDLPSLNKLQTLLKYDLGYEGGREHLRMLLMDIGFKFKKCSDNRLLMIERSEIIAARTRYLRKMRTNEQLNEVSRPIIYLDEIYIGASLTVSKEHRMKASNVSDEYRWVIVNAAYNDKFLPGNLLIYNSHTKTGTAHDMSDIECFGKWLREKIISSIDKPALFVICNLPYYQMADQDIPPPSAKKQVLQEWLSSKNVKFEPDMRNVELYELILQNKAKPNYIVDDILKSCGHDVIHLPKFHADLNPIECMWKILKERCGTIERDAFKSANSITGLVESAFRSLVIEDWYKEVWNVKNLEWQYWTRDVHMEEVTKLGITEDSCDESDGES